MLGCKVSKVDYGETMKLRGLNTDNCATSTDKHCKQRTQRTDKSSDGLGTIDGDILTTKSLNTK